MSIWNGMKVIGETFSPTEQSGAWDEWNPKSGCKGLEELVEKHRRLRLRSDIKMRAADRMLQHAKKHGAAIFENGEWKKIASNDGGMKR